MNLSCPKFHGGVSGNTAREAAAVKRKWAMEQ